jgi:putative tricarboxylic transport membrane protein
METIYLLLRGFSVALSPENLFLCAVGVITGTLVGALPGIGSAGACAILLPATFKLGPVGGNLLRDPVWRDHHFGPDEGSRRVGLGGDHV